jgi:putative membrane protein
MEQNSKRNYVFLGLKGMAMGAADVVPGVSGGTIAFITGIYEELISSINGINLGVLKTWKKEGFRAAWKQLNGTFLAVLFGGIAISILSLVKVVTYFLEVHPVLIWSFFFGLIVASSWLIGKAIKKWNIRVIITLIIGGVIAAWISSIQTVAHVDAQWYIFLSGAVAICAMILPGISGSFILVLMGSYHTVLEAVKELKIGTVLIFMAGCLVGILSFAKVLKFLFLRYKEITIALLTGFMIGSLIKVWPWKVNVGSAPIVIHSNGKEDWMTANVLPQNFDGENQLVFAIVCLLGGFLLVVLLERFAPKEA